MNKYCTYKTTHPTGFYYFGKGQVHKIVHGGYQGSGIRLNAAFSHYPKVEWTTTILETFDDEDRAYQAENELITLEVLSDPLCLNMQTGGREGKSLTAIVKNLPNPYLLPNPDESDKVVIDYTELALETLKPNGGVITTTSRAVAEKFGRTISSVNQAISNLQCSENFLRSNFKSREYHERGKTHTEYLLTRDGFCFLVMGFTGAEAAKWKEGYIEAFNLMEEELRKRDQPIALPVQPTFNLDAYKHSLDLIEYAVLKGDVLGCDRKKVASAANRLAKKITGIDNGGFVRAIQ